MNVTIFLPSRELQAAAVSLPQLRCALLPTHKAVTGFLSATASPGFLPVCRGSSCAQVLLAGTQGLVPIPEEAGLQAQSWQWTLTELMTDFLPGRVIGKHKTLTVPGFSHGVLPCSFILWQVHVPCHRRWMPHNPASTLSFGQKLCQRGKLKDQK